MQLLPVILDILCMQLSVTTTEQHTLSYIEIAAQL